MTTTLPIPLEFRLPDGWRPAPPDEVGAPGVAFVALHPASRDNFVANITISGDFRPDHPPLPTVADESVERLSRGADVQVADRQEVGSDQAPGLTQVLLLSTTIAGVPRELVQSQVYLALTDQHDAERYAVIELVLTATPTQLDTIAGDFQQFVGTVQPAPRAGR